MPATPLSTDATNRSLIPINVFCRVRSSPTYFTIANEAAPQTDKYAGFDQVERAHHNPAVRCAHSRPLDSRGLQTANSARSDENLTQMVKLLATKESSVVLRT